METKTLTRKQKKFVSLDRLEAVRLLVAWRKKYAAKLKGFDAAKAVRELRNGKYR